MFDAGFVFYLATSAFVLAGLSWCRTYRDNPLHLSLPPGPPSFPIVGSIFSLDDRLRSWVSFNNWRSKYGDIVYARMLNKRIVVVNSEEIARDLFEGRSTIYSDKPQWTIYEAFASDFNISSDGHVPQCMVTDTMNKLNGYDDGAMETAIKEAASIAYAAAAETSTSTLLVFLLAMVLHPEVQAKAQAEIDRVVGKDRLLNFNDRPALPYVDALLRETFRWQPVFPIGLPHSTTTSDIYKGYFIPKDVVVIINTWQVHTTITVNFSTDVTSRAMTRNEKKFPSPDEFKPERFLHENGSLTDDKMRFGFGWGRRMCAGQHLADASMWISITSFLAAFSVHKALDEHGKEIPVVPKFTTGIAIHPETFPCRIVPRFNNGSAETLAQLTGLGTMAEKL
ncbi:cytochrome P450 [Rhizopogon vinicolor AM-OR11-026]|uniref:Cytochrome P450 n=1 Tax=Rhizopogon vinicolor AM-OR11-026 TaxID=1314800 RepID=A0A1B7MN42_9AGAM|nr:cytochrome P450 [Rhizopogon vinicolor AM-OR11-026]